MTSVFDQTITSKLDGATLSFYNFNEHVDSSQSSTDIEDQVYKISVKEISNPIAYDELNNPTQHGIVDEALGVSAMDKNTKCKTCGCDHLNCPGHLGHIKLISTCYNPFTIKWLHKLLKAKCLGCHRIRIPANKIELFEMRLKLIKLGYIVESNRLGEYTEFATDSIDSSLKFLKKKLDVKKSSKGDGTTEEMTNEEKDKQLTAYENIFEKEKEYREIFFAEISAIIQERVPNKTSGSSITIAMKGITKEVFSSIIPGKCPHCSINNPRIRKEGASKFFQMPLSNKDAKTMASSHPGFDFKIDMSESTNRTLVRRQNRGSKSEEEFLTFSDGSEIDDDDEVSVNPPISRQSNQQQSIKEGEETEEKKQKYMNPLEIREHIRRLWLVENTLLDLLLGTVDLEKGTIESQGVELFFMSHILVSPNRFRPETSGGKQAQDDREYLHAHSAMLTRILKANQKMRDTIAAKEDIKLDSNKLEKVKKVDPKMEDLSINTITSKEVIKCWIDLQDAINTYLDSSLASRAENREKPGLRQLLERKEGIFRMKMMGKRVNYAARSVISPDPYISTDNIGIPSFMAQTLTFPESVSDLNLERLKQAVINGSHKHPGANFIEDKDGNKKVLDGMSIEQRMGEAALLNSGGKTVYRHLLTGDPLLVNRQPTLHKPSIMAHIARVLPKEQTIRMHYANCKSYNADFDGDEINVHLPQNFTGLAEAYEIAATHKQYIVPTSGSPIRGLIQDFIVSASYLTCKDTFLTKDQYNQLVYASLGEFIDTGVIRRIHSEVPAILKSRQGPIWTGKQVISTLLKNLSFQEQDFTDQYRTKALKMGLNLKSKAKLENFNWGELGKDEDQVYIKNNELLQGILDKKQLGDSEFGLVHAFYELYGSKKAGEFLTAVSRLLTAFLQYHGFTCGVDDALLDHDTNRKRDKILEKAHKKGIQAGAQFCGIKIDYTGGQGNVEESKADSLDEEDVDMIDEKEEKRIVQEIKHNIRKRFVNEGLHIEKEFDSVVQAEMSNATTDVIDGCVPSGLVKDFPFNNISAMVLTGAKGGTINRSQIVCLLGQQELEGKRVPRMPNGKTLPSFEAFDPNPRSSGYISDRFITGLRPQDFYFHCMAGREGLVDTAIKTARSGYLQRCLIKQLESLVVSYDLTVRDNDGSILQFLYGEDGIDATKMLYLNRFDFLEQNYAPMFKNYQSDNIMSNINMDTVPKIMKQEREKKRAGNESEKSDQIITSTYNPSRYLGAISERMNDELYSFLKQYKKLHKEEYVVNIRSKKLKPKTLQKLYFFKYMNSLIHPGENVGTLAGQGIGEPSTQMTLNTFHLAGHGGTNVTLGIPRLREILMTCSENLKTPLMVLPLRKDKELTEAEIRSFANKFQKLKLSEVTNNVQITRDYILKSKHNVNTKYTLTFEFEDMKKILSTFSVSAADLKRVFTTHFVPLLMKNITKQSKKGAEDTHIVNEGSKSKHMKAKEQLEDEEFLETYKKDVKKGAPTLQEGEGDDQSMKDGFSYENEEEDKASDASGRVKSDHVYDEDVKTIEGEDFDSFSQQTGIKIDMNKSLSSFRPYLQHIQYKEQQDSPFSRANIQIILHLPLEMNQTKILMLSLVEAILQKVLIRSVRGIEKSFVIERKTIGGKEKVIQTEGINFEECFNNLDIIDVNRIETNNIVEMMNHYGIEAARFCIIKEIRNVFSVYGIDVDYRHLSLVADFMTHQGTYRPFNRVGMSDSNSPFLKASFETSTAFLTDACLSQTLDDNTTPSSSLVLGQIPKIGTGVFDLLQDYSEN